MENKNLGAKASKSVIWAALSRIICIGSRLFTSAVLARILTPNDFGIVSMALVFGGFLTILADSGIKSVIVQFQNFDEIEISISFWFSVILGCIFSILLFFISPIIERLANISEIAKVISVLGIGLFTTSIGMVPAGILQKELRFKEISLCEIISELLASIFALTMAYLGYGYWSLVLQTIISSSVAVIFYFYLLRWIPKFVFRMSTVKTVFKYSSNILFFNIISYWARNFDSLIIGHYYGAKSLGYYNRAYSLMMYPYSVLHSVISPVIHPILANIKDDIKRMYTVYIKIMKFMAVISLPLTVSLGMLASPLMMTAWGNQWVPSIKIFQILCIISALQPIMASSSTIYLARNRTDLYFKIGAINTIMICLGIYICRNEGITGIAFGYVGSFIITVPLTIYIITCYLLKGKMNAFIKMLGKPLLISALLIVLLTILNILLSNNTSPIIHLFLGLTLSAFSFFTLIVKLDKPFIIDFVEILPMKLKKIKIVNKIILYCK